MRKKESAENEAHTVREKLADAVDISKEILLDTVLVSCIGNREMTLENYKGILEYSDACIRIKAKPNAVTIKGSGLELKNVTRDLLYITGRIDSFSFTS